MIMHTVLLYQGNVITPDTNAKLFGLYMYVDTKLNFDEHVSSICITAGKQV